MMSHAGQCPVCGSPLSIPDPEGLGLSLPLRDGPDGSAPTVDSGGTGAPDPLATTDGSVERSALGAAAGATAGRYRIDGEIARGGMGVVLKGRDASLGRDVALKVLRDDSNDRPDLIQRFIEEAQIGGQLQHPGVVPIYELGAFADRRPFFSMKLVRGRTLAELLAARTSPTDESSRFLGIFEQIAQTVAYAHARGVIHRDLKPSNVMVGGFGEVQVMDWGLAKVLSRGEPAEEGSDREAAVATSRSIDDFDTELSRPGSAMGTPSYMSPEQARGEIQRVDERADVFALGSMLCEILTGAPAFVGRSSIEIQGKAARGETTDALARLDAAEAEPELIALARDCLAVERDDRPRDAGVVADRITARLAGVRERLRVAEIDRARAETRAVEERRRRRLQLGLAASLLAFTTLGGLALTYELHQRQARAARADRLLAEVSLLRDQALAKPEDVAGWERAGEVASRLAEDLGSSAPAPLAALQEEVRTGLEAAKADRALLARLVDIRSAEADDADGSISDAAYADAFNRAGINPDRDDPARVGALVAGRPATVAADMIAALDAWTMVRGVRRAEGFEKVLAAARAADPDPDRDILRAALLVKDKAQRLERLRPLAERAAAESWSSITLNLLGVALDYSGDVDAGVAVLRRASWSHPGNPRTHYELALALDRKRPPRTDEVIRAYSVAWGLQPELAAHELAHALGRAGRGEEADAVWLDLIGRRPDNGRNLGCYGDFLKARGRGAEAAAVFARAIATGRAAIRLSPELAEAHFNLGNALGGSGDLSGAIAAYREAIRLKPDLAEAHSNLGLALGDSGDLPGAIASYREAIRLNPDLAEAHSNLGNFLTASGDLAGAIAACREAIRLNPDIAQAHHNLGNVLAASGDLAGAIASCREAIRLNPDLAEAHTSLGGLLGASGDLAGAIASHREAIRLNPDLAEAHYNLGNALTTSSDLAGAITSYHEAIRLNPDFAEAHCNLGLALMQQARYGEALAELRRGHDLGSKRAGWPYPSAEWVAEAEHFATLASRLPAILAGKDRPADNAERLALFQIAHDMKRHAAATQLMAEAIEADPKLVADPRSGLRYNAACSAALAAAGKGDDDPKPDDAARAKLRERALNWLKAERDAFSALLDSDDPNARADAARMLGHWWEDPDLAGVRDAEALQALPAPDRADWRTLWDDVDRLLKKASGGREPPVRGASASKQEDRGLTPPLAGSSPREDRLPHLLKAEAAGIGCVGADLGGGRGGGRGVLALALLALLSALLHLEPGRLALGGESGAAPAGLLARDFSALGVDHRARGNLNLGHRLGDRPLRQPFDDRGGAVNQWFHGGGGGRLAEDQAGLKGVEPGR